MNFRGIARDGTGSASDELPGDVLLPTDRAHVVKASKSLEFERRALPSLRQDCGVVRRWRYVWRLAGRRLLNTDSRQCHARFSSDLYRMAGGRALRRCENGSGHEKSRASSPENIARFVNCSPDGRLGGPYGFSLMLWLCNEFSWGL